MAGATWTRSRRICRRIEVEGTLTLLTPASFGGEAAGVTDMPLLRDPLQGVALLPGASIAGALRAALWELEQGYGVDYNPKNAHHQKSLAVQLFGAIAGDAEGIQSPLIVDDALGAPPRTEVRDGVAISATTRTAADDQKFDMELLRAGTTFPLRFELLISAQSDDEANDEANDEAGDEASDEAATADNGTPLRRALAQALALLETRGEIHLGRRKRRGFGECQAGDWRVREWDLTTAPGLLDYLAGAGTPRAGRPIKELLYPAPAQPPADVDRRAYFRLRATFALESSLLIRAAEGAVAGPDAQHLQRPGLDAAPSATSWTPLLPGTSLAGALRARARRIAQTLHGNDGARLVDDLFGRIPPAGKQETDAPGRRAAPPERYPAGRVEVSERPIVETEPGGIKTLVQTRIRIDRLTGGVLDSFLFEEAPLFGGTQSQVKIDVRLRAPSDAEIGLLLQVLKDLWLTDLALGGESGVGRGRLVGLSARLTHRRVVDGHGQCARWRFTQSWDGRARGSLVFDPKKAQPAGLERFATALRQWKLESANRPPSGADGQPQGDAA
ncbi:MAG: hypothetical protein DCC57_21750 [Chloroflexi bacterium]|nr:MAG: hypothetical protein DCC57_21750 [Chloroflexota bacterium]